MDCREAEIVHSHECDGVAEPGKSAGLRVHLLICSACRAYVKQVNLIRAAAQGLRDRARGPKIPDNVSFRLDAALREKLAGEQPGDRAPGKAAD